MNKTRGNFTVMMRLVGLIKPLLPVMICAVAMGIAGFLCAIFITIFGGYSLLEVLGIGAPMALKTIFVCVLVFALLRGVLHYAEQACNHYIAFKLLAMIREKVFIALRRLAPAKLEGRDKGNLISILTTDIELLEVFYAHTVSPICIAVAVSLLMVLFIGQYHLLLGLIALIGYLVIGLLVPVIAAKKGRAAGEEFRAQFGELSSFVLDSLRGIRESIQYHTGQQRLDEMNARTDALSGKEKQMKANAGTNSASTSGIILFFSAAMLFSSVGLYLQGAVGFEGVLIPTIAMMSSFGPVVALANLGSSLQNTFAAGNRVLDILDESPVTEEIVNGKDIVFSGASCENVTFSYENEVILDHFSIDIPEKKVIGITGRSGSGKSTLLKLLMRFWDTGKGTVRVSGEDVRNINTRSLRDAESFVTQDTQLFHDSIERNIKIANLSATHEQVVEACKKAAIHDFIMTLPQGYDTPVGELGETLSGGERQRIGLARAFLHDAPFILLDEPTSNLDSLNEAIILRSLSQQREDKTVVLVSHRASTMRIADKVYSVEHGRMS